MTTITGEATEAVKVKPLEFKPVEGIKGVFDAQSMLGYYRVDDTFQTPTAGGMKTVLPSWMGPAPAGYRHEYASIDEAFAAAQADYEARTRSALVAVPEQTDRYFAVDYTGCLYEWPDREAAIKAAEQFAETANGGEPVRTRAAALAAALVAPQAEGRDTGLREALTAMIDWVKAALECKDWHWDGDQYEAAQADLAMAHRALSPKEPE